MKLLRVAARDGVTKLFLLPAERQASGKERS
jgi:hypothetical protein